MGLDIVGIALDDVLGFEHGIADAARFDVKFGEAGGEELGRGIGLDGEPVFFHGLIGQLAAAVGCDLLLVQVRQRVVVIGGGVIHFARRSLRRFGWSFGVGLRGWTGL